MQIHNRDYKLILDQKRFDRPEKYFDWIYPFTIIIHSFTDFCINIKSASG